jgi:hypothetical protein
MDDGRRVKTAAVRGWYADPTDPPYAKHLRKGGWWPNENDDGTIVNWIHLPNYPQTSQDDIVARDGDLKALYEAGARWSRTNGWCFWEVEGVHGQGHTANGTTSQALAWLAWLAQQT